MGDAFSRRDFLAAGLVFPAALMPNPVRTPQATRTPKLAYRTLGKTGLKVTTLSFGCMTNHDQLDQNLRAMAEPFTQKDEDLLRVQLAGISRTYCRMCGSCGGVCEKGVPVPDVLRFLTYAEGYAQFSMARQHFLALPDRVRAVRCDQCPTCSVRCPNGVKVRERLTLAQEIFA